MDYKEARVYLDDAAKYGSVLGLENMKELLKRLGNPQDSLKFIHISGTNGKGSVLAFLSTILKEAGYKVGRYISPTLFSYRERIQINEEYITKEALARHTERIKRAVESMTEEGKTHPTVFEIETALSFLYFQEEACDLVVLETGLGGLEDATNVVTTTVMEVIASISMDHMGFLGNTLGEIAAQKAGIIKPDTLVVSMEQKPEAMEVIEKVCREKNCLLKKAELGEIYDIAYGYEQQSFSYKDRKDLKIRLAGSYQIANAALAAEAVIGLRKLGYEISEEAERKGFFETKWPGRFTLLRKEPVFFMDGAHNEDGAKVLKESLETYFKGRKLFFIMGVFRDKEYEKIGAMTAPMAEHIITIETPGNPRALPAEELAHALKKYNPSVEEAKSIPEAVEKSLAMAEKDDVIIAFGSLSFLGEIAKAVRE